MQRPRPQVHHRQLIVLAVPGKDFLGAPGFLHQRQRLAVALALLDRHHTVGDRRVGRQSGRKPATKRPPLMQSIMAYSSAIRVGGLVEGKVEPGLHDRHVHAVGGARQHRAHQDSDWP